MLTQSPPLLTQIFPLFAPTAPTGQDLADLRAQVLTLSRQNTLGPLTPWFSAQLDQQINLGRCLRPEQLQKVADFLVEKLKAYRIEANIATCVLGMSGGVDSALTAALFKKAGWKVIGVTLPIHQVQAETDRGVEAIAALGLDGHIHVDLSGAYDTMLGQVGDDDLMASGDVGKAVRVRRGNVRARLRMITLFNLASKYGGLVASTDNLSERQAGFWTLAGDIGNTAPIQSLTKSWEVPYLARLCGVPESTVTAVPTDGLGIDAGDEAQLGCSYLEWDLLAAAIGASAQPGQSADDLASAIGIGPSDRAKFNAVFGRMKATWFKRMDPVNIPHPFEDRYGTLERTDHRLFVPPSFAREI